MEVWVRTLTHTLSDGMDTARIDPPRYCIFYPATTAMPYSRLASSSQAHRYSAKLRGT